jgi:DNA (cytosine-5)-methyltransferase 1
MTKVPNLDLFSLPVSNETNWWLKVCEKLAIDMDSGWPDRFGQRINEWSTKEKVSIKTLSLFSGGGGLDIGFADAGFKIIEQVEIDPRFSQTLENNKSLHHAEVRCIDIREYEPSEDLVVDMIIGGPPCQTFSAAGRRSAGVKGTTDPRGTLFQEYVRLLQKIKPKAFLFENVAGILGAEKGEAWKAIIEAFKEVGYQVHWKLLDAADYGVPQHRERVFIVGVKEGSFKFPRPTHGPDANTTYYTAKKATESLDLPESIKKSTINGRWSHLIPEIPPGLNYSYYTAEMGHPQPIFAWRSKFSDFMYKADPDTPVRTIKAQGGQYTGPFSWENRHFDVAELKRLQTFPDAYILDGKRNVQIHQIGNSVPPQIGRILALSVLDQVFSITPPSPILYLEEEEELNFKKRKRELTKHYAIKAKHAISQLNIEKNENFHIPKPQKLYFDVDLTMNEKDSPAALGGKVKYGLDDGKLLLDIKFEKIISKSKLVLHLKENKLAKSQLAVPFKEIIIKSNGNSIRHMCFLWKALERYLFNEYKIDDLVQFSGYYQYTPKIIASLEHSESDTKLEIASKIISGICINNQMHLDDMSKVYAVNPSVLLDTFKELKLYGYEIRNHNTNPQIRVDEYLVPYIFPSMNDRSLQRFKDL